MLLNTSHMSPEELWEYSRCLWWNALQKVSGGAAITCLPEQTEQKDHNKGHEGTEQYNTTPLENNSEKPMTSILCLPILACRRYKAYRAGLTIRAICRIKKKFMNQSLKMSILRDKYHRKISLKYKKEFMKWLWAGRLVIIERFERAVGLQKNLRRFLVRKHYLILKTASIVFQKYFRGKLGRLQAQIRRERICGNWPKVEIVYERCAMIQNASGPIRLKILKCGLNYMLEGFDYHLCLSYRGFLPQARIEELCNDYPYGVTGSYSLRKRLKLQPYHVDEMCALIIAKMALVEPIKGLGEMEERSRAGHGVLVLVVDPLKNQKAVKEQMDGSIGFDGIQGEYVDTTISKHRRENISYTPWMTKSINPMPMAPSEWSQGSKSATAIWKWWKETLWMWRTMVYSEIPIQVRAAHRLWVKRQNNDNDVITDLIGAFQTFDTSKDGYLSTNVIETALLWLGNCESSDKEGMKEMILEGLYVADGTDAFHDMETYARSRAAEIAVGTMIIPNLKFGYINYSDFINRCNTCKRSSYSKKGELRTIMYEYARKLRHEKDCLLAWTVGENQ